MIRRKKLFKIISMLQDKFTALSTTTDIFTLSGLLSMTIIPVRVKRKEPPSTEADY